MEIEDKRFVGRLSEDLVGPGYTVGIILGLTGPIEFRLSSVRVEIHSLPSNDLCSRRHITRGPC